MNEVEAKLGWFKSVVLPHQPVLRARLRRSAAKGADLDDLAAEVMARAYANPDWRGVGNGRAYLLSIARNLMIDLARREKIVSFEAIAEYDILHSGLDLDAQLCARDELRLVQGVLDAMPGQCRRVFVARRVLQKSVGEIADDMALSVSTVEKHLAKAIRLLMEALAEQRDRALEHERHQDEAGGGRGAGGALRPRARSTWR